MTRLVAGVPGLANNNVVTAAATTPGERKRLRDAAAAAVALSPRRCRVRPQGRTGPTSSVLRPLPPPLPSLLLLILPLLLRRPSRRNAFDWTSSSVMVVVAWRRVGHRPCFKQETLLSSLPLPLGRCFFCVCFPPGCAFVSETVNSSEKRSLKKAPPKGKRQKAVVRPASSPHAAPPPSSYHVLLSPPRAFECLPAAWVDRPPRCSSEVSQRSLRRTSEYAWRTS